MTQYLLSWQNSAFRRLEKDAISLSCQLQTCRGFFITGATKTVGLRGSSFGLRSPFFRPKWVLCPPKRALRSPGSVLFCPESSLCLPEIALFRSSTLCIGLRRPSVGLGGPSVGLKLSCADSGRLPSTSAVLLSTLREHVSSPVWSICRERQTPKRSRQRHLRLSRWMNRKYFSLVIARVTIRQCRFFQVIHPCPV